METYQNSGRRGLSKFFPRRTFAVFYRGVVRQSALVPRQGLFLDVCWPPFVAVGAYPAKTARLRRVARRISGDFRIVSVGRLRCWVREVPVEVAVIALRSRSRMAADGFGGARGPQHRLLPAIRRCVCGRGTRIRRHPLRRQTVQRTANGARLATLAVLATLGGFRIRKSRAQSGAHLQTMAGEVSDRGRSPRSATACPTRIASRRRLPCRRSGNSPLRPSRFPRSS